MTTPYFGPDSQNDKGGMGALPDEDSEIGRFLPIKSAAKGAGSIPTVNARELHLFLEVGKVFAAWIRERIEAYGFVENVDFVTEEVSSETGKNLGGRPRTEYHLTLGMAKELSMVERNQQGKRARRYFIACEERLHSFQDLLNDPRALRTALIEYSERIVALEGQVTEMAPKAEVYDIICTEDSLHTPTETAQQIRQPPRAFHKWLEENKWLKRGDDNKAYPFQDRINRGWMRVEWRPYLRPDGSEGRRPQALFTGRGVTQVAKEVYSNDPQTLWDVLKRLVGDTKHSAEGGKR